MGKVGIFLLPLITLLACKAPEVRPVLPPPPAPCVEAKPAPAPPPPEPQKAEAPRYAAPKVEERGEHTSIYEVPTVPIKDPITKIVYVPLGLVVEYNDTMTVGNAYKIVVNAFRGTVEIKTSSKTTTMHFQTIAAKKVSVNLTGDAFKITPKFTNAVQTLLPEGYKLLWEFEVVPLKAGTQTIEIKLLTSDSDAFSVSKSETKTILVTNSIKLVNVKANQLKEHYIRNQVVYNALGGIIVFLSGFIVVKKT